MTFHCDVIGVGWLLLRQQYKPYFQICYKLYFNCSICPNGGDLKKYSWIWLVIYKNMYDYELKPILPIKWAKMKNNSSVINYFSLFVSGSYCKLSLGIETTAPLPRLPRLDNPLPYNLLLPPLTNWQGCRKCFKWTKVVWGNWRKNIFDRKITFSNTLPRPTFDQLTNWKIIRINIYKFKNILNRIMMCVCLYTYEKLYLVQDNGVQYTRSFALPWGDFFLGVSWGQSATH